MNKKLAYFLIFSLCAWFVLPTKAQNEIPVAVDKKVKSTVIDSITAGYDSWTEVSMSGKLSSSILPVSPSVKIYMEKGKLVEISVSAFLVGEVARIEVDTKGALIVNKMNDTYTTVSNDRIESVCPGGLEVLQNLLLG